MLFSLHYWTIYLAFSCNRTFISSMCMYAINWIAYLNPHIYTICSLSVKFKCTSFKKIFYCRTSFVKLHAPCRSVHATRQGRPDPSAALPPRASLRYPASLRDGILTLCILDKTNSDPACLTASIARSKGWNAII